MKADLKRLHELVNDFARDEGRSVAMQVLEKPGLFLQARGDTPRPAASVLKIAIVMTIYQFARDGAVRLDAAVSREELGRTRYRSILEVFDPDHTFRLHEVCHFVLATSDNPAAQYLLNQVGRDAVNRLLEKVGCTHSYLDAGYEDQEMGKLGRTSVMTALDAIQLLTSLTDHRPENKRILASLDNGARKFRIGLRLPDDLPIANKTGSLEGVVNDVALIRDGHLSLALAILTDHQADSGRTGVEIGDFAYDVWRELGGRLDELR